MNHTSVGRVLIEIADVRKMRINENIRIRMPGSFMLVARNAERVPPGLAGLDTSSPLVTLRPSRVVDTDLHPLQGKLGRPQDFDTVSSGSLIRPSLTYNRRNRGRFMLDYPIHHLVVKESHLPSDLVRDPINDGHLSLEVPRDWVVELDSSQTGDGFVLSIPCSYVLCGFLVPRCSKCGREGEQLHSVRCHVSKCSGTLTSHDSVSSQYSFSCKYCSRSFLSAAGR